MGALYIRGGGGGLITGCIFCFQVDGPITGRAYKRGGGGGGAYNRNFTVIHRTQKDGDWYIYL